MKKDIKWLKDEVNRITNEYASENIFANYTRYMISDIKDAINQLDEPELLSHELPVLPEYVAEYLEFAKKETSLIQVMETVSIINGFPAMEKVFDWISVNDETFARAWLDGYEIEEEPLYYALIKGHDLVSNNVKYWVCDERYKQTVFINFKNPLSDMFTNRLTKKKWNELGVNDTNADFVKANK